MTPPNNVEFRCCSFFFIIFVYDFFFNFVSTICFNIFFVVFFSSCSLKLFHSFIHMVVQYPSSLCFCFFLLYYLRVCFDCFIQIKCFEAFIGRFQSFDFISFHMFISYLMSICDMYACTITQAKVTQLLLVNIKPLKYKTTKQQNKKNRRKQNCFYIDISIHISAVNRWRLLL